MASTKAFTTQLVALFTLAATLAKLHGRLDARRRRPSTWRRCATCRAACSTRSTSSRRSQPGPSASRRKQHALFLGRGMHYPIALEGALKLKEISYIHAEAYPAGELKHGPLALVDADDAGGGDRAQRRAAGEGEVEHAGSARARRRAVTCSPTHDSHFGESEGVHVIRTPRHVGVLSPIVHAIPVQLLAYHAALARGTDVDKPRNLAKSVTVE